MRHDRFVKLVPAHPRLRLKTIPARRSFISQVPPPIYTVMFPPVHAPAGNMIVDIGGGPADRNDLLAGIVFSRCLRVGGDEFDETIRGAHEAAYT